MTLHFKAAFMSDHREAIKVLRKALRGNVAAERKEKLIKQSAIADGLANNVPSSRRQRPL